MDNRKGFTLIELLVVIAIIALLIAILIPALQRVKKQAKSVICQSNLKHWGVMFSMYTNDNNGYFPSGRTGAGDSLVHWMTPLRPYYSNIHDFCCCPMATKPARAPGEPLGATSDYVGGTFRAWGVFPPGTGVSAREEGDYGSYCINEWVYNPPPEFGVVWSGLETKYCWRTVNVKRAGDIPVFVDGLWHAAYPKQTDSPPIRDIKNLPTYGGMPRICINRHEGGINGLFVDFSVRKIGLKELWKLRWHRGYKVNDPPPIWPDWMKKFKDY